MLTITLEFENEKFGILNRFIRVPLFIFTDKTKGGVVIGKTSL